VVASYDFVNHSYLFTADHFRLALSEFVSVGGGISNRLFPAKSLWTLTRTPL